MENRFGYSRIDTNPMASLRDLQAEGEVEKERRQKLQTLPDPMQLAQLAAALKPVWARGTIEKQRQAVLLARSLFDCAVEAASRLDARELAQVRKNRLVEGAHERVAREVVDGVLRYDPTGAFEDELQAYIKACGIRAPKKYGKSQWGRFVGEHGFEVEGEPGLFRVAKKLVTDEVSRIKRADADRKAAKRIGVATAKKQSRKKLSE